MDHPYETLELERAGTTATLWLNRPEVHNAFNEILIAELDAALAQLERDPGVRVLVVAGRGTSFCAGADLRWMERAAAAPEQDNLRDAQAFAAMLYRLAHFPKPTLARVHGAAVGGGVGLAAACDLCLAGSEASFAMTEVRLGLIPAVISPYVVRAIGARQSLRYMQTAERVGAPQAQALGLVNEVAQADALDALVAKIVQRLALGGPQSQAACKALVASVAQRPLDPELTVFTAAAIARQRGTDEARAGMAAFFAHQPPPWQNG